VYKEDVLQGVVNPLNMTLFNGQEWVFQQDSAPAHKTKMTQEWLRRNLLTLISTENWPSGSPDLNPLDCKLWAVLKDRTCQKHHSNLESLKKSLVKVAAEILLETVCVVAAQWLECHKACVEAGGGHFE
jgi:inhibitor of nuclear factor kappa-B kinase subunit alpha